MILSDLIETRAKETPDNVAFIFQDDAITYGQLLDRVNRCAQGLLDDGLQKGDRVGLVVRNCPEFVILAMALAKMGGVAVPVNFLEKPDRIALIFNDAKAVAALTARDFGRAVLTAAESVPTLKKIYFREENPKKGEPFGKLLEADPLQNPPSVQETDLVFLLYTSGTTGAPKGVMLSHKNLLRNAEQCLSAIELTAKDRFLCLLPMFHSFAWTTCVTIPLKIGASCVINESLLPFDPVIKAIWKHKVTLFVAVPQIYSALTAKIRGAKALVLRFLNPIRLAISGAAPLPDGIHKNFEKTFGIPLLQGYGLTETAPVATLNPEKANKRGSVGKALAGVSVGIFSDDGKQLPAEEVGEIWIKGDNVMSGYYNRPEETAESLTPEGWLKTGDMGKLDEEGYLTIVDRKKDLIIVKGLNVYPQEVEAVIQSHAAVNEVAVVGKPDPETGEEMIRAFVTAKEGQEINKAELFDLCRQQLAAYKRPKSIIVIEEMPKNALQKILKKDLRAR